MRSNPWGLVGDENDTGPKHASGYFKNINGTTVDTFSITHD